MFGIKILFLEDDVLYQATIRDLLEEEGYVVDTTDNGQKFIDKIFNNVYDLYIMDINVPKINGFQLMSILTGYHDDTMKLILSSDPNSVIKSFQYGCDDFLNKNTDIDELLIRIKTLIKRAYRSHQELLKITEHLHYDLIAKKLYKNSKNIEVEVASLPILDYLIKERGRFISSNELEKKVYPCNSKSKSNLIRYHVWSLRNILGKEIIESRKNIGYKI